MIKKIIIFVFLFIILTTNFILFSKENSIENNEIHTIYDLQNVKSLTASLYSAVFSLFDKE